MMRGLGIQSDKIHWKKTASVLLLCLLPLTNGCSLKNVETDKDAAVGAEDKMEEIRAFQDEDREDAAEQEEGNRAIPLPDATSSTASRRYSVHD